MNDDRIHGANEDQYLEKLIERSSVGNETGRGLARRSSRARVDQVMGRIRKNGESRSTEVSTDVSTSPVGGAGEAEVQEFVRAFVSWMAATKSRVVAGLTRLYYTVFVTEAHEYVSRRLASYFFLTSGLLPFPEDNPIISTPNDSRTGKRRREVLDDIAMVSYFQGSWQTVWPSHMKPDLEQWLQEMDDSLYQVDLRPHSFWQMVDLAGRGHRSTTFMILFVWRVVDPVKIVGNGTTSMEIAFHTWLRTRTPLVREAWAEASGGVMEDRWRRILSEDLYWHNMGISLTIELMPFTAVKDFEQCPPLPSIHNFMMTALQDPNRWFPGTSHLVETESGRSIEEARVRKEELREKLTDSILVLADNETVTFEPVVIDPDHVPVWRDPSLLTYGSPYSVHSHRPNSMRGRVYEDPDATRQFPASR